MVNKGSHSGRISVTVKSEQGSNLVAQTGRETLQLPDEGSKP